MTRKKWILLADANANAADQTLQALAASYAPPAVVVARNGAEVLDCLHGCDGYPTRPEGDPAVVLLELKMPKVDGWEVLRHIKNDPRLKSIPVVLFTDSRAAGDLARGYQLGANAYVVKPSHFRQLAAVLEDIRAFWIVSNQPPLEGSGQANSEQAQIAA